MYKTEKQMWKTGTNDLPLITDSWLEQAHKEGRGNHVCGPLNYTPHGQWG